MSALPATYKACCYNDPGKNSIEIKDDMAMPEPNAGEVLVHLTHSGVCQSDYAVMTNGWSSLPYPAQPGQVGGHEGVGEVVKLGPGADAHCKLGDRVGIKWIASACGTCENCLEGFDGGCTSTASRKISGYYTPGTFQQYVVAAAHYVTHIPDGLDSAAAAPMLCGGVTVYSALRKSGVVAGQTIAILGAGGGLGHLAVQTAARGMAFRVIGIDHSSKRDLVLDSGAEQFFAIDDEKDVVEAVKAATGGVGVQAALVLTGNNKAYEQALSMLRFSGRLVCVGVPEGTPKDIAGVSPSGLIFKAASIVGVAVGNRKDAIDCLAMAARGTIKVHYRVEPMANLQNVFQDLKEAKVQGRVVLDLR